jgi:phosphate transport system substrate-binding protein
LARRFLDVSKERSKRRRWLVIAPAVLAASALALMACGSGSAGGEIRNDGSSTVFPISEAVAEEFSKVSDARVNVAFSGTSGGFERFCRGEIEVANASREIDAEETQACAEEGIADIIELRIATDALTVVVNPNNDFLDCLTVQQLHDIFTGAVNNWSEVEPSYPDESIIRFFPGTDSGTFDYFVEAIVEDVEEGATHTADGTASEDDNVLAQGVGGEENAIGYFGFAYYQEAGSNLKAVAIDNGEGCVEPSAATALDGTYAPLSRALYIYTSGALLGEREEVIGFVNFYLENAAALAEEVGYIAVPEDVAADQVAKIEPFLP